ncbi:MAG: preprotein translocase subunit SecA [Clostridia bacterium]|jgi:preprotein translocase subunit SecA|nr:preprotein translocase subunit SecA [Clostridia bacterium]
MGLVSYFANLDNRRNLKKLEVIAEKVEALASVYALKSDEELKKTTNILKDRLVSGETLNDILPDAYALVRESSARVLNMRHFHAQILGGIALHQGRIAEMRTGEGKTLVATMPAYLNALTGKGVHVVTVNDYLARRDAEWMGKVYTFLGLTVGITLPNTNPEQKRNAYMADITYGTNNEYGFDYLRDNMVLQKKQKVQRPLNFGIVDEVDNILIDEARTPLIISGRGMKSSEQYTLAQKFVSTLKKETDTEIDEEKHTIHLSDEGMTLAERFYKIESLSDVENMETDHHIRNALIANFMRQRDIDYIVKNEEVIIVDEFTGRLMPGRRYSDGLHQAIEAKENVKTKDENKTIATITFQNYFRMYSKLSGMTGTAKTEEGEFNKIYNLDVIEIPTNKPMIRYDMTDMIFTTRHSKLKAIVNDIKERYENGQPVLVGTITIEKSEELSKLLKFEGIPHSVLNAKNHERESEIVAQAGRYKAVTIATNMAGRGTDILLGGNPEFLAKQKMREMLISEDIIHEATAYNDGGNEQVIETRIKFKDFLQECKVITDLEKEKVIALGGLHIIGTERHESRRIDNQLRGRAGRQGDPGSSIFYISLEDDLARIFGGEKLKSLAQLFNHDDDEPFQIPMMARQIEVAQKRIEQQHFVARKYTLEYDDVMNKQREIIYGERNKVLDGVDVHQQILDIIPELVEDIVYSHLDSNKIYSEWNLEELNKALEQKLYMPDTNFITLEKIEGFEPSDVANLITDDLVNGYNKKVSEAKVLGVPFDAIERDIMLKVVDKNWMDHIDEMAILSREIVLQQYGQRDPVVEYKREGFKMFDEMISRIRETLAIILLKANIQFGPNTQQMPHKIVPSNTIAVPASSVKVSGPIKSSKQIGRNEQCPCGSGKKYKNCCGKSE